MKNIIFILFFTNPILVSQTTILKVWPDGVPGSISNSSYNEDTVFTETGGLRIRKVTDPLLYVYLPPNEKVNGTAVVICPGGAYMRLAIDIEGYDVAKWFNAMGVVGIVLKYRLPSDDIMKDKTIGPLQDVLEAIRIVRRRSKEWKIDPEKIGVMGFSAGGHLAASASTLFNENVYDVKDGTSARPDFSILVYPVISMNGEITHAGSRNNLLGEEPDEQTIEKFSTELRVTEETPPAFLVHAADDHTVPVANSIVYFESLNEFSIPAELHIYETGGHGFGLAAGRGTESNWPDACTAWLKQRHFIE
jgi:acetyl esterase/lipase